MSVETIKKPYEFLARWDDEGNFQGAHAVLIECTVVDGVVIARKIGDALTPEQAAQDGFPFSDVLSQLQADALARVAVLEAETAEKDREKAETAEAHAAEVAALNDRIQGDAMLLDTYRRDRAAMVEQLAAVEAQLAAAQESPLTKALGFFKSLLTP